MPTTCIASLVAQLVKNPPDAGDLGSIPGLGRSPEEGNGYPLWYSGLENSTDYTAYGVAELDTTERLSLSQCPNPKSSGPWWLSDKEPAHNAGDMGSIPGLGTSPGEANDCPLQ